MFPPEGASSFVFPPFQRYVEIYSIPAYIIFDIFSERDTRYVITVQNKMYNEVIVGGEIMSENNTSKFTGNWVLLVVLLLVFFPAAIVYFIVARN